MRKSPHTAGGILSVETLHIDGGIERLPLHGALEYGAVPAIPLDPACPLGDLTTSPAIETGDVVVQREQQRHEAGADIAGSADDTDSHARNTPL